MNKLTAGDVVAHEDFRFITIAALKSIGFKKDFDEPIQKTALSILHNGVGDENLSLTTIIYNHARWANSKRKTQVCQESSRPKELTNVSKVVLNNAIDSNQTKFFEHVDSSDFVNIAIKNLCVSERKVYIFKRLFDGLSQTEISDEIGVTSQSVSEHIKRFIKNARENYENTSRKNLSNCG